MAGVEERRAVGHRRVGGEDAPDDVALERRRRGAEERRHPGEGVEVVVDQHLAGDADHLAEGLDAVGLLRLADGAALELAGLVDLLELRRLAELQPVHQLEVGDGGAPGDRRIGPRRGLVGVPQRLVGDAGEDRREVRGRVQRPGGDLVAAEAADPHALRLEPAAGHLDQRQAAPLAGRLGEREAAGVVAVQQRRLDRGAPGLAGVEPAGADMRPGLRLGVARRGRVDQRRAGGIDAGAAGDEVVGDRVRRRRACARRPGSWRCGAAPRPGRARPRPAPRPGSAPAPPRTGGRRGLRGRRDGAGLRRLGRGPRLRGRRRLGGRVAQRGRSGGLRRRGLGLGFAGHGGLLGDGRRGAAQEMAGMGGGLGRPAGRRRGSRRRRRRRSARRRARAAASRRRARPAAGRRSR